MVVKCKDCGGQMSSSAPACPHCGALSFQAKMDKLGKDLIGAGCAIIMLPFGLFILYVIIRSAF